MRITLFIVSAVALFLMASCQKDTKKVTPSGYEYIVHTSNGGAKANPGDYVYFHAQMRNADSTLYASRSFGQEPFLQIPMELAAGNRQPSPVEDVLREMSVGDSVTVIINLDTIPNKPPGFENAKEMYYDVVLVNIKDAATFEADANVERERQRVEREAAMARLNELTPQINDVITKFGAGQLSSQVQTTGSGLKYMITEQGTGTQAKAGDLVTVHYYGALTDGSMFDNSFSKGTPFVFTLGRGNVIPGWDEGIALLKEGGKAYLFIPSDLGYGEQGSPPVIPGGAELVFYVELEKVN